MDEPGLSASGGGRDLDLVVVGEINPDIVVRAADPRPVFGQVERWVDTIELVVGSSSVIAACGAARLGLRTAFTGLVGEDPLGRFMLAEMASRGIDVTGVVVRPDVPTGATVVLSSPDDRAILTAPGAMARLTADDVPLALLARARHAHVGAAFLQDALRPGLAALFRAARDAGTTTSIDPNWDPSGEWDGGLRAALAVADVFLPNASEASRMTGLDDPEEAARALVAAGPSVVVVKCGAAGGIAATSGGERLSVPSLPVTVRDTTGAGDSFDAGFLTGWLHGLPLGEALALAVACGSLSTTGTGGVEAQPTLAEARAAARRIAAG